MFGTAKARGLAIGLVSIGLVSLLALAAVTARPASADNSERYYGMGSLTERPQPNPLKNAYFGDLHVHTKTSVDSFLRSNMLTMADAYRFGHGEEVVTATGEHVKLTRPLDFMALTDHSESYQTYDLCVEGHGPVATSPNCLLLKKGDPQLHALLQVGDLRSPENCGGPVENCLAATKRVWQYVQKLAAENYVPGKFTSFIGYEYSATVGSMSLEGGHMHRNVLFRNTNVPDTVFSALDSNYNYDLWRWLAKSCTGKCDVMAIPHNSNLSWGMAFALETTKGEPYTPEDWKLRARFERLVEIFQIKGDSECGVGFGSTDEQCNFEQFFTKDCNGKFQAGCVTEGSFVRNALKQGLGLEKDFGFNPFKLGFIADTDTHNAIPGSTDEKTYPGSIGRGDGTPETRLANQITRNPGGNVGVWATQNNRDAIFDSLENRETFGTSGTRIRVRFFGGWDLPADMHQRKDFVAMGYKLGVPMGGDLPERQGTKAPTFSVWAAYDPESAHLQRIQIIKGWHAEAGQPSEQIYDVVCSDGIQPDPKTHRCADNGASVDISNCSTTPNKGAAELATTWTDPDFDPKTPAFYYVRVLENPTCRWSTYDLLRLHKPPPPYPAPTIQERAWSSPIWYQSKGVPHPHA